MPTATLSQNDDGDGDDEATDDDDDDDDDDADDDDDDMYGWKRHLGCDHACSLSMQKSRRNKEVACE